jgi:hypothetical protein
MVSAILVVVVVVMVIILSIPDLFVDTVTVFR